MWGWGPAGYGRTRYDAVISNSGANPNVRLHVALDALRNDEPIKAYELLLGGTEAKKRSRLGTPGFARMNGLGPAFFTKFLYSASAALAEQGPTLPGPTVLILDSRLARRVNQLTRSTDRPDGMPYLVHRSERTNLWSCYRYAIYLHWMAHTAAQLDVPADVLEYTLFDTTPSAPNDEWSDT